jgi:hypothetical protein
MKLYQGKIPAIADEIVRTLTAAGDIEVGDAKEATLDVESVLREYLRMDREITDKAKDVLERKNLPYEQFGKIKRSMAEEREFATGEESLNWISNQMLETFMHSQHVDEVFADDTVLRKKLRELLRKHMAVDAELDEEVRRRIKNLAEGTQTWDIEYAKVMEQMKRKHGLE